MKMLKQLFYFFLIFSFYNINAENNSGKIHYSVDLVNHNDDLFKVKITMDDYKLKNGTFNFPATAPGIYSNINFGRYVVDFKALDMHGKELGVKKINTNQYKVDNPQNLKMIQYSIEDTYDFEPDTPKIASMVGTALEDDFAILNTFGVLGYFEETQKLPIHLELKCEKDWSVGTSLKKISKNIFYAENYDKLADSPILLGKISHSATKVNNIDVDLYVYTTEREFSAENLIPTIDTLLQTSSEFIGFSPVNNYTFLMCLIPDSIRIKKGQLGGGALEHNQSSLYYLPADKRELTLLKDVVLHEFLHILTPLNAHSELIHNFNFITPIPSKHLWFYEGVTEWGSTIAQLRSNYKTLQQYLQKITDYLRVSENFDNNYSLFDMSLESYTKKGNDAFINFYNRGAVTACLLDIRLLELSDGKKGLRELLIDIVKEYGQDKFFKDDEFFDIIVKKSFPEIKIFIDDYICGVKPLPLSEFFSKVGIKYISEVFHNSEIPSLGTNLGVN